MAEEIAIRGSSYLGKERSPIAVALLQFVPIYPLVHYFKVNKELAELGQARGREDLGDNPMLSVLALVPGFLLLLIPPIVSVFRTWKRQETAREMFGVSEGIATVPGALLTLLLPWVGVFLLQRGQNALLEAQSRA